MMDDNSSSQYGPGSGVMSIGGGKPQEDHGGRPSYSMPGILHFLQTEWARFEMERAQWEVERAELQARIAFLQGERKGQENLKQDLVRRIKMLEYALKQERAKYHKLKFGTELNQGDMKPPVFEKDENDESVDGDGLLGESTAAAAATWKQGRHLLRQYLQEIGYTDTIIDVRSARVRQLLGLAPAAGDTEPGKRPAPDGQGRRAGKKSPGSLSERVLTDTEDAVNSTFSFLNDHLGGDDDEDENLSDGEPDDDDGDEKRRGGGKPGSGPRGNESLAGLPDDMDDADDTLHDLDEYLAASEGGEGAGEARSDKKDLSPGAGADTAEWGGADQQLISKLKDQYRKERQKAQPAGAGGKTRPKRADLKQMLDTLSTGGDEDGRQRSPNGGQYDGGSADGGGEWAFSGSAPSPGSSDPPVAGKRLLGGAAGLGADDDLLDAGAIDMGDLVGLTINNEADAAYDSVSASKEAAFRKTWTAKYTLRSHFDGVRALAFHPAEPVLITASEDHTLKLWNLQKTVQAKKTASLDVEPVYTFRGHTGPVLSLVMAPSGEVCYSGSADATIRAWNIPSSNIDPYDSFDRSVLSDTLVGHTDAVWGLAVHQTRLLSCSADGSVRLWSPGATAGQSPLLNTFRVDNETGVPTSVDFVRGSGDSPAGGGRQFVVAYSSANAYVFSIDSSAPVTQLDTGAANTDDSSGSVEGGHQINRVVSHPTLPVAITAHDDRHIRFFDVTTGRLLHAMVAHLDAVTSLAVDPNALYLLSGSHDCSIRLWNLDTKTCVQEITSHRKKFEESIHDAAFHPSKPYIASAGADALAKVFV